MEMGQEETENTASTKTVAVSAQFAARHIFLFNKGWSVFGEN